MSSTTTEDLAETRVVAATGVRGSGCKRRQYASLVGDDVP